MKRKQTYAEYAYRYLTKYGWELICEQPRRWWRREDGGMTRSQENAVEMQRNIKHNAKLQRHSTSAA